MLEHLIQKNMDNPVNRLNELMRQIAGLKLIE